MKKLAVLVTVMLILSSIVTGCGTPAPANDTTAAAAATTAAGTTAAASEGENINGLVLPISTTGEEVTIMLTQVGEAPDTDMNSTKLPMFEELEKRTGVKLNFKASSSDNYGNVLLPLLASGSNLPDLFVMGGADLVQMGKDGTIIDLKDLMQQNCPNTMQLLEKWPLAKYSITSPEGQIWGFPGRIAPYDDNFQGLDLGYRLDWVQKLGLKEPETLDDWYNMLVAFRDGDPNGNRKKDEVPFAVWSKNQIYDFALAFGMSPWSSWFTAINDKIVYDWTSGETSSKAREYTAMMAKWYKEKLLDQSMLVEHSDASQAQLVGDQAGAEVTWTGTFAGMTAQMKATYPNAVWQVALPPKGPYGDQSYENYPYVNGERWMISKSCKNPATVLKLLDYLFATEEGQILNDFGIEGKSYEMKDGKPEFIKSFIVEDHYKDPNIAVAALGCGKLPHFVGEAAETQIYSLSYSPELIQRMADVKKFVRVMFPFVTATKDESEALKKMTDLNTTLDEYLFKFVTGSKQITDATWSEFVGKLKSQGIDEMVKIKQDQYNRYYQK